MSNGDDIDFVTINREQDAMNALETLNLNSWSFAAPKVSREDEPVRGWLVSPLHPMARTCRWSVSNYLLATPACVTLFLEQIAALGRERMLQLPVENFQNRFRLSRMKVTGP